MKTSESNTVGAYEAKTLIESRREVILKMRELASRNRLNRLRVKDLIAEGRK